ncbi:acetyltransferase, GNAT family protein [Calothrix sp. NIES-4101]|nr:acetyltransferase, GNAT family protein [Calothrix sp. NIES-4101]
MQNRFYLPPNFFIRRARAKDKWKIKKLLLTWNDGVNILPINIYWLGLIILCLLFLFIHVIVFVALIGMYLLYEVQVRDYSGFWVIDYNGAAVGCAELRVCNKYSVVFNLCIKKIYRHQKLGSCMVEHLINEAKKPIYLSCDRELIPFYTRFGFATIHAENLPRELPIVLGLTQSLSIVPMVLV